MGDKSAALAGLALLQWCAESDTGKGKELATAAASATIAALGHYGLVEVPKADPPPATNPPADNAAPTTEKKPKK